MQKTIGANHFAEIKHYERLSSYILHHCIDNEAYEVQCSNDAEKVAFLLNTFEREYGHEIKRYKSVIRAIAEWLAGLPTACTVPFMNYDILEKGRAWGMIAENASEKSEDHLLGKWFIICAWQIAILAKRHEVARIGFFSTSIERPEHGTTV